MPVSGKIENVPLAKLKGYDKNARTHSPAQVEQLAAAIREFGFTNPILIDDANEIIAGHGRLAAATSIGMAKVPCIRVTGLTPAQIKALRISDNQIALNAGWNEELLRLEIGELKALDFDVAKLGFSAPQLNAILVPDASVFERAEETPAVDPYARARLGDVFVLGAHRIICGDATVGETVAALLAGAKPHLMVTDPPYGVRYDPDWRNRSEAIGWSRSISIGTVENDDVSDWRQAYALFAGDVAYVWHPPGAKQVVFFQSLVASGFEIRMQIVWAKPHFPVGRGNYHVQHEPCWYAVRKGSTGHWSGDRKQTTLWQINNFSAFKSGERDAANERSGHGTQKPIECMRRPILNNSAAGDAVYDPFIGSGTTLIACEMEGRRCYGIEISPAYCDVTVKRWQQFTGKQATREADGAKFDDLQPLAA